MTFLEFLWIWDKLNGLTLPQHHKVIGQFLESVFSEPDKRKGFVKKSKFACLGGICRSRACEKNGQPYQAYH